MMKYKNLWLASLALGCAVAANAQQNGGINQQMLNQIQQAYQGTPADKAIRNAIGANDIRKLTLNQEKQTAYETNFSVKVNSKGITDQKSSGRCWLFTGLNVLRSKAIAKYDMPQFEFSQIYCFFWDQLEKSNLFLQSIIQTADKPMDDKMVEWLFRHPLSDGGTFTGVADLVNKYGLVPKEAMPETYSSDNTRMMASLISTKLKEYALELREMVAKKTKAGDIEKRKTEMLSTVYRMLVLNFGVPPTEFDYNLKDKSGKIVATEHHTPKSFFEKYGDKSFVSDYVMLMNDPTREYYKCYEITNDRHLYDGNNWKYLNLPMSEIKEMAIASLKDSTMLYYACDITQLDSKRGLFDMDMYDYGSLLGVGFGMDKKERIQTFTSGSAHAMTLMAVDLDANGKPTKWMVENSWGPGANNGHLIMTDKWFDEYTFRLVVEKKYVTEKVKELMKQKPTMLPAWDPMFSAEE